MRERANHAAARSDEERCPAGNLAYVSQTPRATTARYAGCLQASLPPFWTTDARQAVLEALRRSDAAAEPPLPVQEMAVRFGEEAAVG